MFIYLKKQWHLMFYKFYLGLTILFMKAQLDSLLVDDDLYWHLCKYDQRFMTATEWHYDHYLKARDEYYYRTEMAS